MPAHAVMPVLEALTDLIATHAEARVAARGEAISCAKGCGACCRMLVPVSEPEARRLGALVAALPAPRRRAVETRFDEAKAALAAAEVLNALEDATAGDPVDLVSLGAAYLFARVPCPFLEEEACAIHADRPLVCREVSVTSDPAHCVVPWSPEVSTVPVAGRPSRALIAVGRDATARGWVPLVLALDFAATADDPPRAPATAWIEAVLARMADPDRA